MRIKNDKDATLTVKSKPASLRRLELEYKVPLLEAEAMMQLRQGAVIEKLRHIVPWDDHRFLLGATQIESSDAGPITVRSMLELLGAAYALHPAFGEARIIEFGSGLRPAFPDNLPRIAIDQDRIAVNGLYRHGFLLAPALAELTLGYVVRGVIDNEVMRCA